MPDVQEVFRMATQMVKPEPGALDRQHRQQRRSGRNRKAAALAMVAVIIAAIALFASVVLNRGRDGTLPAIPPGRRSAPTFTTVGSDGSVVATIRGFDGTATPDLSPDGTTIAFTIHDWSTPQIATMHVDGTGFQILTNDPIAAKQPRWSPDGTRLVYFRQDADGILRLMVMDADGSNAHQLEGTGNTGDFNPPEWSPDGSQILYTTFHGGPPFMATIPVTGGRPHFIETGSGWPEVGGAWSPDGRSIAYTRGVREEGGGILVFEVWVMNADGTGGHPLAALEGASAEAPAWSPDGSKVAFIGTTSGIYRNGGVLYVIDVASGEITEVLRGTATGTSPREPADLDARRQHLAGHDPINLTVFERREREGEAPIVLPVSSTSNEREGTEDVTSGKALRSGRDDHGARGRHPGGVGGHGGHAAPRHEGMQRVHR